MICATQSLSLFPAYALPRLRRKRGRKWSRLVGRIARLTEVHPEYMAFTLMLRRLAHLLSPNKGKLCMEPGCVTCALDVLAHYDGNERDLINEYHRTLNEVQGFLATLSPARLAA